MCTFSTKKPVEIYLTAKLHWFFCLRLGFVPASFFMFFERKIASFLGFFEEFLMLIKRVITISFLPTWPSVLRKKYKKTSKKVLTIIRHSGIIYKSTRYGNKTKAKIVRHEPWKLNINLEKSECAGRAFYNARPSQITSF